MHPNEQIINNFYSAFQKLDWQAMQSCYTENIHFSDPVFNDLNGEQVGAMWHMLCNRAKDFELNFTDIKADDTHGSARWLASYTFSQTGRRVNNVIFAEFQFSDGKISRHSDHFSFWKWSQMALGPIGLVLGWSSFLKNKVHQQGLSGLNSFIERVHSKKDA